MTLPKRVMIAAWGSRGDLQPVTALALGLKKEDRDVIVFATLPATDLLQANKIDCVIAQENVADFVENMFGQADLSDRTIGGLIKLANFAKKYVNSSRMSSKSSRVRTTGCFHIVLLLYITAEQVPSLQVFVLVALL